MGGAPAGATLQFLRWSAYGTRLTPKKAFLHLLQRCLGAVAGAERGQAHRRALPVSGGSLRQEGRAGVRGRPQAQRQALSFRQHGQVKRPLPSLEALSLSGW